MRKRKLFQLKEEKYSKKKKENIQHPTKRMQIFQIEKSEKIPIRKNKIFQLEIEKWQK